MSATHKKDLRTGKSLWMSLPAPRLPVSRQLPRRKLDCVVIGAGISGALAADALSAAGLSVAILDRRGPVRGATPASTALLQYEIDTPLSLLARRIGRSRAERLWRRSRLALDALRERARHLRIDADLVNRDSLYLQGDLLDAAGLQREALARRRAGFEVSFLTPAQVRSRFGIAHRAALLGYDNLAANPRRLTTGFLAAALARGATLHAPQEVAHVEPGATVRIHLAGGGQLRAGAVVFATGYELPRGVPHRGHRIVSTWVLATHPQRGRLWEGQAFLWEAADPYLYVRVGPGRRIICGGEDEDFADEAQRDALLPAKIRTIARKLAQLIPGIDVRAEFAWTGCFGASITGTPTIGPIPRMRNCYGVLGYGGNGITFSMLAAQVLRAQICGNGDPDQDLVSFTRRF
ncbi:MAG: FAD-dependent oxidoreductase [Steroidobacteraceae bacterium]